MASRDLRALVAGNVRKLAKQRGVAINSLADFAGVSRAQLYDVLAGRKGASLDWIAKLAVALDVAPWQLLHPNAGR